MPTLKSARAVSDAVLLVVAIALAHFVQLSLMVRIYHFPVGDDGLMEPTKSIPRWYHGVFTDIG